MKPFAAFAALAVTLASATLPALAARDSYVIDNAHMLSATATQRINQKVGDFNTQTGKEVVVDTEPSLNGATLANAAEKSFAANQVNGVLIYIAKGDKQFEVVGDRASRQFFPSGSFQTIHDAMRSAFNQGNIDDGVNTGVDLVLNQYRSHEGSLNRARSNRSAVPAGATTRSDYSSGGFHMSWIWWLIALAVIFFVIRGIFRAIAGPRMYPPGYGGGGPMMGGPGYGPGYGGGYGGGGGGFWSGMLGGLGGAFLGNELFGNRGGWGGGGGDVNAGFGGVDSSAQQDASGWQSDAGQADMGNAGGGGWGDSGGGWGGGDSGGGGGDGGGGW